ncbi:T-complex protein 11-like protein 1 isoform X1 [Camelus bactrianus]|uniref:T-complex protein 11-like protein 1 isoform X1 n=3 Tax=Camelus bactrianus TaxID=9837 RepID=A0A9W3GJ24_CAMBA
MSENLDKSNINETGKSKSNDSEQGLEDAVEGSEKALQKKIKSGSPSTRRVQRPHASPPRFVTVEELLETAKGVTNMALAHEIVVNGDFRIKPVELPEDSLEKRVKDIVHKAFWDCLSVQLSEDPPTYDRAIKLVGEIKETLLSFLLPGHTRLRNQITEVLDLDLIKQEAENGALDISKLAEFIIGMMGTLCAPVRDEEVKKLKDIKEIVPLFRAIFSVLDLMKVDMANFAVSSIRPHLMQQSVEYERKQFQEILEKQPNSLDFVTQWLEEAADDLLSQKYKNALPAGEGAAGSGDGPSPDPVEVQNYAYLMLLKWDHLHRPFPETVLMDHSRFQELQLQLEQLAVLGAVLLVTFSMAAPGISSRADFAEKLKMFVKILLTDMHLPKDLDPGQRQLPPRTISTSTRSPLRDSRRAQEPQEIELLPSGGCPDYRRGESLPGGEQLPLPVRVQPPHHGQGGRAQGPGPRRGQSRQPHPQDRGVPNPDLLRCLPCLRSSEATAHSAGGIGSDSERAGGSCR